MLIFRTLDKLPRKKYKIIEKKYAQMCTVY